MFQLSGSNKYEASKFYTKSTDGNGHYEQVRIKLTPAVEAMIQVVVADCPEYETLQDFIRDSVNHRLVYYRANVASMDVDLSRIELELQISNNRTKQQIVESRLQYIKELESTIDVLVDARDWEALVDSLNAADEVLASETWPDGPARKLEDVSNYGWTALRTEQRRRRRHEE